MRRIRKPVLALKVLIMSALFSLFTRFVSPIYLKIIHAYLSSIIGCRQNELADLIGYVPAALSRLPSRPRSGVCHVRAWTIFHFLKPYHENLTIRYGLRKRGAGWQGHCWLELDGKPFLEDKDRLREYTAIPLTM